MNSIISFENHRDKIRQFSAFFSFLSLVYHVLCSNFIPLGTTDSTHNQLKQTGEHQRNFQYEQTPNS